MKLFNALSKVALAGLIALLCVGCDGRKEEAIANKDDTIRKQETLIAQERADKDKLAAANDDLAKQNTELARENTQATIAVQKEVNDLEGAIRDLGLKVAQNKAGTGVGANQDVSIEKHDNNVHIIVANQVLFGSGKADLKSTSHPMLLKVAQTIKNKFPHNSIRIEGHTDSTPVVRNKDKYKDDMDLSIARSRAVYDFLIKEGGLPASKMFTAGYGEHQPLAYPEKTAADRAKNRRVEIVIMPSDVKVQKDQLAAKK